MAVVINIARSVRDFYFVLIVFNVVAAFQLSDKSYFSPSIINIQRPDGSYLQDSDLLRTIYHIEKRSAILPPIKKATTSEKKPISKNVSTTESVGIQLKTIGLEFKNAAQNSTLPYNSTLLEASSFSTISSHEKYDVSDNSSTTSTSVSSTSAATVSSTTPLSTTSGLLPDMLPTKPPNITNTTFDHHVYYNSTLFLEEDKAMALWVNFEKLPQDKIVVHRLLSDSYRRAATVTLTFDFPFYGHPLRNITIATGGFIYMGDYMHSWLAATQYIAPLMANFDTSFSNDSTVRYFDNGTAFIIEWHEVSLQDGKTEGNFTFQATLLNSGNIIFAYKNIPVSVTEIEDDSHPVKVGLSDAYVMDKVIYFIRRKTIYEYHRIEMKKEEISNHTAIYFTALTTCLTFRDCKSCMEADVGLDCIWCDFTKRCSDGLDRMRQDWLQSKCDVHKSSVNCSALPDVKPYVQPLTDSPSKYYTLFPRPAKPGYHYETTPFSSLPGKPGRTSSDDGSTSARVADDVSTVGVGSVISILLILAVLMGGLVWVGYAYRNPHTSSGQLLIRYRPSQWRFRSGEARYTAASVHM
ncbi:plexin domain-containing protein 2-like [Uloborus diversus]|uniref:plexin domain-containing protein 2-like n=1 Tax=Uloborus diversus TaxID=327109 RepID=UPI002409DBBA|nr:plexin domain-containing protein 2-like [Uloborus diversus]